MRSTKVVLKIHYKRAHILYCIKNQISRNWLKLNFLYFTCHAANLYYRSCKYAYFVLNYISKTLPLSSTNTHAWVIEIHINPGQKPRSVWSIDRSYSGVSRTSRTNTHHVNWHRFDRRHIFDFLISPNVTWLAGLPPEWPSHSQMLRYTWNPFLTCWRECCSELVAVGAQYRNIYVCVTPTFLSTTIPDPFVISSLWINRRPSDRAKEDRKTSTTTTVVVIIGTHISRAQIYNKIVYILSLLTKYVSVEFPYIALSIQIYIQPPQYTVESSSHGKRKDNASKRTWSRCSMLHVCRQNGHVEHTTRAPTTQRWSCVAIRTQVTRVAAAGCCFFQHWALPARQRPHYLYQFGK